MLRSLTCCFAGRKPAETDSNTARPTKENPMSTTTVTQPPKASAAVPAVHPVDPNKPHEDKRFSIDYNKNIPATTYVVDGTRSMTTTPATAATTTATSNSSASLSSSAPEPVEYTARNQTPPKASEATFTQRALVVNAERKYELRGDLETPAALADDEVRIRTAAVGLNQIDFKSVDFNFCLPQLPWITGREMAGVVDAVGVSVERLQPGQRVWTSTYYRDRRAGCFQDRVIVPQHTVLPLATDMTFTSGACLGVCGLTAAMTLWRWFGITMPYRTSPPTPPATPPARQHHSDVTPPCLLVWGGSSVTGQFLVQLAKRSGLRVLVVGSAQTADLLTRLGADQVVVRDGKSNDEIVAEVRHAGGDDNDDITMGIDLVGAKTALATMDCLSRTRACRFAPLAWAPKVEVAKNVEVLNVEMKQFVLNPESAIYAEQLTRLVDGGEIRLPEIEVLSGGLGVVEQGLERLKRGDMAGKKLIVDMMT